MFWMIWCSPRVIFFFSSQMSIFDSVHLSNLNIFGIIFNSLLDLEPGFSTQFDMPLLLVSPGLLGLLLGGKPCRDPCINLPPHLYTILQDHSAVVRNKTITRIIPSFNLLMINNKHSFSDWHCILHLAYLEVWFILLLLLGSGPNSFLTFHIHPIVLQDFS